MERCVEIKDIIIGERSRKDLGDLDALAKSIETKGLLHLPVVTEDNRLVVGQRRLEAIKKLGNTAAVVRVAEKIHDFAEIVEAEREENVERKPFTTSEAVDIGRRIEEAYKPKAEEAASKGKSKGGKTAGKGRPKNSSRATCPKANGKPKQDESKRTTAVAAKASTMGRKTYEKAKAVVEAAEADPQKYGPLRDEMDRTEKVDRAFRKLKIVQDGIPEIVAAVESGEMSVSKAYQFIQEGEAAQLRAVSKETTNTEPRKTCTKRVTDKTTLSQRALIAKEKADCGMKRAEALLQCRLGSTAEYNRVLRVAESGVAEVIKAMDDGHITSTKADSLIKLPADEMALEFDKAMSRSRKRARADAGNKMSRPKLVIKSLHSFHDNVRGLAHSYFGDWEDFGWVARSSAANKDEMRNGCRLLRESITRLLDFLEEELRDGI